MNHFFISLWCTTKSGFYMTTSDDQLSDWTEKKLQSTSQSQICTKKRVFVTGGLLPVWSTTAFWIPVKPLHLRTMLSKSMRCTKNWNACSQHWSTKAPVLLHDNAWLHGHTTNTSKVEWIGLQSFASSSIFTWSLINQLLLLQASLDNFLQGKCFYNQQEAENAFQESVESRSTDFYTTGINQLISCWQNVLIVMIPILMNKDVFEPSYNDLKFTVKMVITFAPT